MGWILKRFCDLAHNSIALPRILAHSRCVLRFEEFFTRKNNWEMLETTKPTAFALSLCANQVNSAKFVRVWMIQFRIVVFYRNTNLHCCCFTNGIFMLGLNWDHLHESNGNRGKLAEARTRFNISLCAINVWAQTTPNCEQTVHCYRSHITLAMCLVWVLRLINGWDLCGHEYLANERLTAWHSLLLKCLLSPSGRLRSMISSLHDVHQNNGDIFLTSWNR